VETDPAVIADLERIIVAGVALTAVALGRAGTGLELTFGQWRVMVILRESVNGATISEVARRVGVTVPATSRQLRRLERRGLVFVTRDETDRRATRANLTEAGIRLHESIVAARRRMLGDLTSSLDLGDGVRPGLHRVAEALGS
jgi:DNA-binding MarR family transcriptional regulator